MVRQRADSKTNIILSMSLLEVIAPFESYLYEHLFYFLLFYFPFLFISFLLFICYLLFIAFAIRSPVLTHTHTL
jgi:hypothetical protein